jgi:hypothetical protein
MHSIKHYTTAVNESATYATVYIMNAYQKYPDIYNFVLRKSDNRTSDMIVGCMCWVLMILILRSVVRTCMDPFSVKLHMKITELETKLCEEEDSYSILYDEKCEQDEKVAELTEKLKEAEKALDEIKSQYLSCRQAAQRFLDASHACQGNQT